jgi:hypothetical protein
MKHLKLFEACYDDLTPYTYGRGDGLNIGWLEKGYDFKTGEVDSHLTDKLDKLKPYESYRGSHRCELCASKDALTNSDYMIEGNGKKYYFPGLLKHYIVDHKYLPPQEFLDALSDLKIEEKKTNNNHGFRRPSW